MTTVRPIDEARQLTGKYSQQKLIASFTQAVGSLNKNRGDIAQPASQPRLSLTERCNPDDQTELYLLVASDTTSATRTDSYSPSISSKTGFTQQ